MAVSEVQEGTSSLTKARNMKTSTVVIAMDQNEPSDYALQFYADHLHKTENVVILAHTTKQTLISSPEITGATGEIAMFTKDKRRLEEKADELVAKLSKRIKDLDINGTIERIHGEPGPAIITIANQKKADYIVVGCRGKGAVRKTLTGSVTDYITHHSNVPVVVARHKDHMEHFHLKRPFQRSKKERE